MVKVGYSKNYANSYCGKMWDNPKIRAAIKAIDAEKQEKSEYDYDVAMQEIDTLIASCYDDEGNIAGYQARGLLLSAIKEKNCITGLQKQTITTKDVATVLDPELQDELNAVAQRYKLRKANVG